MSVQMTALVWHIPLPSTKKLVLLRLADFASEAGKNIFPSVARVALECGVSERTLQYTLRDFEEEGLLIVIDRAGGGRNHTRVYAFDVDLMRERAALAEKSAKGAKGEKGEKGETDDTLRHERVQMAARKGATDDAKGCKAFAPEPSENHQWNHQVPPCGSPSGMEARMGAAISLDAFDMGDDFSEGDEPFPMNGTRLPAGWTLSQEEWRWAAEQGISDPDVEAEKFRDYWFERPGHAVAKPDWNAEWRNWVRRVQANLGKDEVLSMVSMWNALSEDLRLEPVTSVEPSLRSMAEAQLRDCGGLAGWQEILDIVRRTPVLNGQGVSGWKPGFAALIEENRASYLLGAELLEDLAA